MSFDNLSDKDKEAAAKLLAKKKANTAASVSYRRAEAARLAEAARRVAASRLRIVEDLNIMAGRCISSVEVIAWYAEDNDAVERIRIHFTDGSYTDIDATYALDNYDHRCGYALAVDHS